MAAWLHIQRWWGKTQCLRRGSQRKYHWKWFSSFKKTMISQNTKLVSSYRTCWANCLVRRNVFSSLSWSKHDMISWFLFFWFKNPWPNSIVVFSPAFSIENPPVVEASLKNQEMTVEWPMLLLYDEVNQSDFVAAFDERFALEDGLGPVGDENPPKMRVAWIIKMFMAEKVWSQTVVIPSKSCFTARMTLFFALFPECVARVPVSLWGFGVVTKPMEKGKRVSGYARESSAVVSYLHTQ